MKNKTLTIIGDSVDSSCTAYCNGAYWETEQNGDDIIVWIVGSCVSLEKLEPMVKYLKIDLNKGVELVTVSDAVKVDHKKYNIIIKKV